MKKLEYSEPIIEMIDIETEDVMTSSTGDNGLLEGDYNVGGDY